MNKFIDTSQLTLPNEYFRQALDKTSDIILIVAANDDDPGNNSIVYVNQAFCDLFEYRQEEIIGCSPRILQGPETEASSLEVIRAALTNGTTVHTELISYSKNGSQHWLDLKMTPLLDGQDTLRYFLFIERDITERKQRELQLYEKATTDSLTALYNRHHTYQLACYALEKAARYNRPLCFVLLDIDYFKLVNDRFGHLVGDKALVKLAQLLKQQVRKADILGRVGGEEFCLIMPEVDLKDASTTCERLRHCIEAHPWHQVGIDGGLTVSMGLAEAKNDHLESLINKADRALYKAKEIGRNQVIVSE